MYGTCQMVGSLIKLMVLDEGLVCIIIPFDYARISVLEVLSSWLVVQLVGVEIQMPPHRRYLSRSSNGWLPGYTSKGRYSSAHLG
jgi:hypothetical protein